MLKLHPAVPKKLKLMYYVAIGAIVFSLAVIAIVPVFIENYLWQFMLLPIAFQVPTVYNVLTLNKEYRENERQDSKKDTNVR